MFFFCSERFLPLLVELHTTRFGGKLLGTWRRTFIAKKKGASPLVASPPLLAPAPPPRFGGAINLYLGFDLQQGFFCSRRLYIPGTYHQPPFRSFIHTSVLGDKILEDLRVENCCKRRFMLQPPFLELHTQVSGTTYSDSRVGNGSNTRILPTF